MQDPQICARNVPASSSLPALRRCPFRAPVTHANARPLYTGEQHRRAHVQCTPTDNVDEIAAMPSTADTTQQQQAAEDIMHESLQEFEQQVFTQAMPSAINASYSRSHNSLNPSSHNPHKSQHLRRSLLPAGSCWGPSHDTFGPPATIKNQHNGRFRMGIGDSWWYPAEQTASRGHFSGLRCY